MFDLKHKLYETFLSCKITSFLKISYINKYITYLLFNFRFKRKHFLNKLLIFFNFLNSLCINIFYVVY